MWWLLLTTKYLFALIISYINVSWYQTIMNSFSKRFKIKIENRFSKKLKIISFHFIEYCCTFTSQKSSFLLTTYLSISSTTKIQRNDFQNDFVTIFCQNPFLKIFENQNQNQNLFRQNDFKIKIVFGKKDLKSNDLKSSLSGWYVRTFVRTGDLFCTSVRLELQSERSETQLVSKANPAWWNS